MRVIYSILILFLAMQTSNAQEVFIARPYLQIGHHPAPEYLELLWHTADSNAEWQVEHRSSAKEAWTKSVPITFTRVAGGTDLYNPEQEKDPDSWQKFTTRFVSTIHSLTYAEVNGKTLTVKQVSADGKEVDAFTVTKD